METLSDMFELDLPTVHSIISKMIINEELMVRARDSDWAGGAMESLEWRGLLYVTFLPLPHSCQASLDQPTQTVVMHRTEPTAQQNLALQLAEKLGSLVENNERVFDHKQGTYGGYFRGEWLYPVSLPGYCFSPGTHAFPILTTSPADQKDGYRKNEGYMRRGGYRQQQSQTAY
jgi:translation initiation factor 3 subunit C